MGMVALVILLAASTELVDIVDAFMTDVIEGDTKNNLEGALM